MSVEEPARARVERKLTEVLDPCSCFTDNPVDIVELGLIEEIDVIDGTAHVELLLTSGGCTYVPKISADIENRLLELDGVDDVKVTQETGKIWTRDRMDEDLRTERREWFRRQVEANDITPYAERSE